MKLSVLLFLLIFSFNVLGQEKVKASNEFSIVGKVKRELTFTIKDIDTFPSQQIGDLVVTNHNGEKKGTASKMRGVLLSKILEKVEFAIESPRKLNEFYIVLEDSDGYRILYSWNELFNSDTGDHVFIVTEKNSVQLQNMEDRILVATTSDHKTGRRYIKGLVKIIIGSTS
ncbi:MAG: molybdopterin-binding protein [Bacteroidota bacterium]